MFISKRTQVSHLLLLFKHAFCSTILNPALYHWGKGRHVVIEKWARGQPPVGEVTATRDDGITYIFYAK